MNWTTLIGETLRAPANAAQRLLGWDVPRQTLYEGILAVAALNALLAGLSHVLYTSPPPFDALLGRPFILFILTAGGLIVMTQLLYWAGRAMGGQGEMSDLLLFVVWLQGLRALAQTVVFVTSIVSPGSR